jgi:hypothetical protein
MASTILKLSHVRSFVKQTENEVKAKFDETLRNQEFGLVGGSSKTNWPEQESLEILNHRVREESVPNSEVINSNAARHAGGWPEHRLGGRGKCNALNRVNISSTPSVTD